MMALMSAGLAELIGSLIFFTTIEKTGDALKLCAALFAMANVFGPISGGHFNPAVTVMKLVGGSINTSTAVVYICGQIAAAVVARFGMMELYSKAS